MPSPLPYGSLQLYSLFSKCISSLSCKQSCHMTFQPCYTGPVKSPAAPWSVLQHQSRRVLPAPLATESIWVFFWVHSCTRLEARIRISSFWVQWSQDIKSRTQKTGRGLFQTCVPNPKYSLWMTLCSPSRCRCRTQVFCVKDGFHLNWLWPPQQVNGLWYWLTCGIDLHPSVLRMVITDLHSTYRYSHAWMCA